MIEGANTRSMHPWFAEGENREKRSLLRGKTRLHLVERSGEATELPQDDDASLRPS